MVKCECERGDQIHVTFNDASHDMALVIEIKTDGGIVISYFSAPFVLDTYYWDERHQWYHTENHGYTQVNFRRVKKLVDV